MNLCSDGHQEICYEGYSTCPLCEAIGAKEDAENKVDQMESNADELQDEINTLKSEITVLKGNPQEE